MYLHRRRHPLRHLKRCVISFSDWMSPSGCGSSSRPFLLAKKRTPLCTRSCSLHPRHNKRECVTKETDDEDEWFMFLSLNSVRPSTPQKGLEDRGSRKNGIHVMFVRSRLQPAHRRSRRSVRKVLKRDGSFTRRRTYARDFIKTG